MSVMAQNAVDGRADIVRHMREKDRLGAVGFFRGVQRGFQFFLDLFKSRHVGHVDIDQKIHAAVRQRFHAFPAHLHPKRLPSAVLQLCEKMQRFGLPYILPKVFEHFGVFFHIQSEHFVSIVQNPVRTEKFTKLVVGVDDLQPLAAGRPKTWRRNRGYCCT